MVARALKITFFSVRVESMGSMEARGRLFLPHWGKWCAGRWDNFTPAPDYNICNRGRAARAWAAADEGGIAATRGWSWTGRWRVLKAPHEFYIPACSFFSRSQELADSLFCCPTGSVGHPVPSVFGCRTWAWTSEPQCTQRHVLPAGWRRGTFPSYSPGLWACMTKEHIKQTYRFVSLETGMNTLKASWYAAIWCNTDEIKPLWHSQNKDMVKKNKGGELNWVNSLRGQLWFRRFSWRGSMLCVTSRDPKDIMEILMDG